MTSDLTDLHRRYDGPVPADERERAMGGDPAMSEARGAVRFWQDRVQHAKEAIQANTRPYRKGTLDETWDHARAGLAAAEKRLASLQPDPVIEGPKEFFASITKGV